MGLVIENEIETNVGEVTNAYVTIQSYTVRKNIGEISFSIAYYTDEKYSKMSCHEYLEDLTDIIQLPVEATFNPIEVLYYKDNEWNTVSFPLNMKVKFTEKIETPILEIEKIPIEKEIPYISFDSEGNEIEKIRKKVVFEEVKKEIGKEERNKIDWSLVNNPLSFAYQKLAEELKKNMPDLKIKNV